LSSVAAITRALLYLRVTTLVGQVRSRLKRLKQPKYLMGALVGAAYVYFFFIRRINAPRRGNVPTAPGGPQVPELPMEALSIFAELGAVALLIALVVNWTIPRRASLGFSEAEIAFLFPAPVNRRALIHYRLLGSQFGIAFTALILTLVLGRGRVLGGNPAIHAFGWWLILAMLNLHFTATSFVMTKLLNRSLTTMRRRVATIVGLWAVVVALIVWTWSAAHAPEPGELRNGSSLVRYLATQLDSGPLPWLLALPRLMVAPFFADGARAFFLALGPALLLLVVHYFWVIRTEVSFEEASILRAEKRAARVRAIQQGDWRTQGNARKAQRPPFALGSVGRPEVAFLWKNLLSTSGFFRPVPLLVLATVIVAGSQWLALQPTLAPVRMVLATMAGMLLAFVLLLGPQLARQDLRSDLANTDILKTYPLRGWQIVLGELLTPIFILSVITWLGLLAAFLVLPADKIEWLPLTLRAGAALSLAALAPPFVTIQLLVPNAAAVIFPAWAQTTGNRAERGIEVMGQRIIFLVGQLIITSLALVPAAIGAAVVFVLANWLIGFATAATLAVAAVFVLLAAEAWLGIRWLGGRYEHFDLSAELRP
jgi:ABC-2 type transport system permease protein